MYHKDSTTGLCLHLLINQCFAKNTVGIKSWQWATSSNDIQNIYKANDVWKFACYSKVANMLKQNSAVEKLRTHNNCISSQRISNDFYPHDRLPHQPITWTFTQPCMQAANQLM